jgi:wobble nucleotide-excising tRNase
MIEEINIKAVASYDETGILINNLRRVNFIYGANGCGKTTISNFLENHTDDNFSSCAYNWFNNNPLKTLVYNKNFRVKNFGKGKLEGIFTLGQASTEKVALIEKKSEQLKQIQKEGEAIKNSLDGLIKSKTKSEDEFRENVWYNLYKKYEITFSEAFEKLKRKEAFKDYLLSEFIENKSNLKSFDELKESAKTIFGEIPVEISEINLVDSERINEILDNSIWKKVIVGKADVDIAKLIQKLNINDWVNQGREYIQEDNVCPFCQEKTITEDFKSQLENYFDEAYLGNLKLLKDLKQEYNQLIENLLNELNNIEETQKTLANSKLNNEVYSSYLKTLTSQNIANIEIINNKVKEPSRSFEITNLKGQINLIKGLILDANTEIEKHNKIVLNFRAEKTKLINEVWRFLVEEYKVQIIAYNKDISGKDTGINKLNAQLQSKRNDYSSLKSEIIELSKTVTSIQPTIDEINKLLVSYGFLNFKIMPSSEEGFYQIQRDNGELAESTLSEGEITFITFLYFLQLAKGGNTEENVNDERILVIDDPISSLDSNVLFVISTLIKEIIKNVKNDIGNIKQIIILTHNVYFHKEVSFEGNNRGPGQRPYYWILRKNNKISTIHPYNENNPIQSSYELLWREIKEWQDNSGTTIQNTMRRILENYFSILGKNRDDILISKFETHEEKDICRSLLSWINEGSHTLPDDMYIELPDGMITKYLKVFKDIFMLTDNIGHYNMMMGIGEENTEEIEA